MKEEIFDTTVQRWFFSYKIISYVYSIWQYQKEAALVTLSLENFFKIVKKEHFCFHLYFDFYAIAEEIFIRILRLLLFLWEEFDSEIAALFAKIDPLDIFRKFLNVSLSLE